MFSRQTTRNLAAAKRLEQQAIATALEHVVDVHQAQGHQLASVVRRLAVNPAASRLAAFIRSLRRELARGPSAFERDLAMALFAGAPLTEPLQKAVAWLPRPARTEELFTSVRTAATAYAAHSGYALRYCLGHPRFVMSGVMGTYVGNLLLGAVCPFDPKAFGRNSSGLLFHEAFINASGARLGVDWTAGPTPTLGDRLAPEAAAVIEALDNKDSRCFQHTAWIYVNLQNIRSPAEGRRSHALFMASQRNPKAFRLASVCVDAPFYHGRDDTLTTLREHRRHLLSELRKGLTPTRSSWYAFSLCEGEHDLWWQCVETVVEKAFCLSAMTGHQIPVFHELVVIGLVRAWQGFCCRNARGTVMSTVACKECIDRGGSVNAACAWAMSGGDEEERARTVQAVLWGRPLLARQRLIEKSRTRGFEALVRSFVPMTVRQYLDEVWEAACCRQWRIKTPLHWFPS